MLRKHFFRVSGDHTSPLPFFSVQPHVQHGNTTAKTTRAVNAHTHTQQLGICETGEALAMGCSISTTSLQTSPDTMAPQPQFHHQTKKEQDTLGSGHPACSASGPSSKTIHSKNSNVLMVFPKTPLDRLFVRHNEATCFPGHRGAAVIRQRARH